MDKLDHNLKYSSIKEEYLSNGYVIIKKLLSENDVENCKQQLIRICNLASGESELDLESSLRSVFYKSQTLYLQVLRTFSKSASVQSLFLKKDLQDVIENLGIELPTQSTQPVTHASSKNLLVEGEYVGIDAHQDWTSIHGSLDSLVVWFPFTRVDSTSYPVQILPKSHVKGIREASIDKKGSIIKLTKEEEERMIDVVCDVGDVVFFSTFTVHRTSNKPENNKFRFSVSTRFDNAMEKNFVDRQFPCAYKRIVERDILNPPSQAEIERIFKK